MKKTKSEETVKLVGGDSTNPNTGWAGGVLAWLEKFLGRKVFWMICMPYTNELPLRHLIEKLDGKTSSKDGFTGPLGKLLPMVNNMTRVYQAKPIPGLKTLLDIPDSVVSGMSTDQSIFYQLGKAARAGKLSKELGAMKCGNLVHSRWVPTAEAFIFLWFSEHGLQGELLDRLEMIVTFVVQVYHQLYFDIKVSKHIKILFTSKALLHNSHRRFSTG